MRSRLIIALDLVAAAVAGFCLGAAAVVILTAPATTGPHPVCLVTHSQVLLIPTLCSKAQVCDMPIVAKVCDQIEIENPRGVNE